jgi:hypothetical protein
MLLLHPNSANSTKNPKLWSVDIAKRPLLENEIEQEPLHTAQITDNTEIEQEIEQPKDSTEDPQTPDTLSAIHKKTSTEENVIKYKFLQYQSHHPEISSEFPHSGKLHIPEKGSGIIDLTGEPISFENTNSDKSDLKKSTSEDPLNLSTRHSDATSLMASSQDGLLNSGKIEHTPPDSRRDSSSSGEEDELDKQSGAGQPFNPPLQNPIRQESLGLPPAVEDPLLNPPQPHPQGNPQPDPQPALGQGGGDGGGGAGGGGGREPPAPRRQANKNNKVVTTDDKVFVKVTADIKQTVIDAPIYWPWGSGNMVNGINNGISTWNAMNAPDAPDIDIPSEVGIGLSMGLPIFPAAESAFLIKTAVEHKISLDEAKKQYKITLSDYDDLVHGHEYNNMKNASINNADIFLAHRTSSNKLFTLKDKFASLFTACVRDILFQLASVAGGAAKLAVTISHGAVAVCMAVLQPILFVFSILSGALHAIQGIIEAVNNWGKKVHAQARSKVLEELYAGNNIDSLISNPNKHVNLKQKINQENLDGIQSLYLKTYDARIQTQKSVIDRLKTMLFRNMLRIGYGTASFAVGIAALSVFLLLGPAAPAILALATAAAVLSGLWLLFAVYRVVEGKLRDIDQAKQLEINTQKANYLVRNINPNNQLSEIENAVNTSERPNPVLISRMLAIHLKRLPNPVVTPEQAELKMKNKLAMRYLLAAGMSRETLRSLKAWANSDRVIDPSTGETDAMRAEKLIYEYVSGSAVHVPEGAPGQPSAIHVPAQPGAIAVPQPEAMAVAE